MVDLDYVRMGRPIPARDERGLISKGLVGRTATGPELVDPERKRTPVRIGTTDARGLRSIITDFITVRGKATKRDIIVFSTPQKSFT